MFKLDHLRRLEREHRFYFPSGLWEIARRIVAWSYSGELAQVFRDARFASLDDVKHAWRFGLASHWVPFFCHSRPTQVDYYSCVRTGKQQHFAPLVLFAPFEITSQWQSFEEFRLWLEEQCAVRER